MVLGSAFLLGISGISIAWFNIDRTIAGLALLMLIRHLGPGFGACAGCMAGLALSTGFPDSFMSITGLYAISAWQRECYIIQRLQPAVFSFGTVLFITLSLNLPVNYFDAIIPVILFMLVPDLRAGRVIWIKNRIEHTECESEKIETIRKTVSEKICDMSKAMYKLGHTLERQIKDAEFGSEDIYNSIIEHLTQKVCISCNKSNVCWETRLFYTYNVMCNLIDSLQSDGNDFIGETERELTLFCVKSGLVVDVLSRIIEIKRVDRVWQKILNESRSVIPEQIYCVSETLTKLSGEVLTISNSLAKKKGI